MADSEAWREGLPGKALGIYDEVLAVLRLRQGPHTLWDVKIVLDGMGWETSGDKRVAAQGRPNALLLWDASAPYAFVVMALQHDPMISLRPCPAGRYPLKVFHPKYPAGKMVSKDFTAPHWIPSEFAFRTTARAR